MPGTNAPAQTSTGATSPIEDTRLSWKRPGGSTSGKRFGHSDPTSRAPESTVSTCAFYEDERRKIRTRTIIVVALLVIVTVYHLTLSYAYSGTPTMKHYSLAQVGNALWTAVYLGAGHVFGLSYIGQEDEIIRSVGMYHDEIYRLRTVLVILICGALLAVAGMLFQIAFKNPIASPTMLGVLGGVQLGQVATVVVFGAAALRNLQWNYVFTYAGGLVTLLLVIVVGKITGGSKGKFGVHNMLLVGAMIMQVFGIIVSAVENIFIRPRGLTAVYERLVNVSIPNISLLAISVLVITALATFIPLISQRFQLNLLSLSEPEIKLGGANPERLRFFALVCGSAMILAANASMGSIAVLSLAVPFIARAVFGVEFRKQLLGSTLLGMLITITCSAIATSIPFGLTEGLPASLVANVLIVPLFAWIMASSQKALDD